MANNPSWDVDRIAGLRMAHLITQLKDDGLSETDIAEAIGCSPSLINKWPMPEDDSHPIVPKGIRDDVIAGIYRGGYMLGVTTCSWRSPRATPTACA